MNTHREHNGSTYIPISEACSLAHLSQHQMREAYARGKVEFRIFDKQIFVENDSLMRMLGIRVEERIKSEALSIQNDVSEVIHEELVPVVVRELVPTPHVEPVPVVPMIEPEPVVEEPQVVAPIEPPRALKKAPVLSPIQNVVPAPSYLPMVLPNAQKMLIGSLAAFAGLIFVIGAGIFGVQQASVLAEKLPQLASAVSSMIH